jgi:uroporphyrinogen decarboxylase
VNSGKRLRATYEFRPVDHLVRKEFSIWPEAIERWKAEGLPDDYEASNLFQFDPPTQVNVGFDLGWCEPPFVPAYEDKIVRREGETDIVQDRAGRWLRVFRGRRHGFMPTYVRHSVTGWNDWEREVAPRLDPENPERYLDLDERCDRARDVAENEGRMVRQGIVGGYMYLRALMGPEQALLAFHDQPDLVRTMMERWAEVMNAGLERVQARLEIEELAIGEDICYNHGMLISPTMYREFLLPHYQDVIGKARRRQHRRLFFHVDTDGWAGPAIPLYREAGMDVMSPFEVAAGCDIVELGRQWPDLVMSGGIDKRALAAGPEAIEEHVRHVLPPMVERGGYIPTCNHGVPVNVSLESYMTYRRLVCELDH